MKTLNILILGSMLGALSACTADIPFVWEEPEMTVDDIPDFNPDYSTEISEYDGTVATDAANDVVGTDKSYYWEANGFTNKINVVYSGSTAKVESTLTGLVVDVDGAYVTVDLAASGVKNVDIVVSGASSDGALKIYGKNKFKLTLNGVQLESHRGPAINDQCKKRVFVHVADGTTNTLKDSENYVAESYYADGATFANEDAKGCFFSEGHMIVSGTGSLHVAAQHNHGIATDGYLWVRPGVTLVVTEAAKNAIHAKGSTGENLGIVVNGGYIYANVAGAAGKCMKSDNNIVVNGGVLALNCSSQAQYDADERDISTSACVKSDMNIVVNGGAIMAKCTGDGARNLNADGDVRISGGSLICMNTGVDYVYNSLTSEPKTVNANGSVNVAGGEVYSYSQGRGFKADTAITVADGKVYAYSVGDYSMFAPKISVDGGTVLSVCADSALTKPSNTAYVNGGYVVSVGNSALTNPDSKSAQAFVVCSDASLTCGKIISLANNSQCLLNYTVSIPDESVNTVMFSTPDIEIGVTYSVLYGGTVDGATDVWHELSRNGIYSNGIKLL